MSKQRPIAYEPHPVTPERKAELRGQGYQIIDAVFKPREGGPPEVTREALDQGIASLPGDQTDPDYVVRMMRSWFGDLFTADDEAKVRELVKAPAGKPSDGLKVDELKAALAAKNIEIPEGVRLKEDLAKLLDEAA